MVFSWCVINNNLLLLLLLTYYCYYLFIYFPWNRNLEKNSSWLVIWRFCVAREEPKFFTDIHDFTTLFYVILRCKSSKWLQGSIKSDWYTIDFAIHDFAFFKHCFYCKNRSLKRVFYLLIFVNLENKIVMSVIRDPLFFLFMNHARDPPSTTLCKVKFLL